MPSRLSVIPAEAVEDIRLTDGDIRVLAALGTFTDRGGKCWPSVESVASVARCSERSVQRSFLNLEKCGFLNRVSRWGRSNVYVVKLDTPDTGVTPDTTVGVGVTLRSPTPDTSVTHNVPSNGSKNAVVGVPASVLAAAGPYLRSARSREARIGMLRGMLQGISGRPVREDVLCRALEDMVIGEADFRPVVVRTWCDRAVKLIEGEAGRRAAEGGLSIVGHPDANQPPSEDDL